MKKLWLLLTFVILMGCSFPLIVPTPSPYPPLAVTFTLSPTLPLSPTPTVTSYPILMCTPPPCAANQSYFCPGSCPGGCGTTCATMTPDPSILPEQAINTKARWLVYVTTATQEGMALLDPSGQVPGNVLREVAAFKVVSTPKGAYFLTEETDTSVLWTFTSQEAMQRREIARLETPPTLIALSLDAQSLVWAKPSSENDTNAEVFLTSLEDGKTRPLVTVKIPANGAGHWLKPLFYDAQRGYLLYAFHTFYSGMTPGQVASLYLMNLQTGESIALAPLHPPLYAGYSAAVDPSGQILAYLTWHGEPDATSNLSWQLHLRSLENGQEKQVKLEQAAATAEVSFFSPDGRWLLLNTYRYSQDGTGTRALLLFDAQNQAFSLLSEGNSDTFYEPRAWSKDGWLILTSEGDGATWATRPAETKPVRVTSFRFLGLIQDP